MRNLIKLIVLCILLLSLTDEARSQFFQVYGYKNLDANEKELVMWNTFIPSSDHSYEFFGNEVERAGMFAHSVELEYGITHHFTVALYADFEQPRGNDLKWIRSKAVMIYYRFLEKNMLPIDLAIYGEYKLPRPGYENFEEIEVKLIMEKDVGFHKFILNPTLEKKISGDDIDEGMEFVLNGAYAYTKSLVFQPRIEYYSTLGGLYDLPAFQEQEHYIFPSFDLFFGKHKKLRWQAGVGFGLTDPADNIIVKSIIAWEFF